MTYRFVVDLSPIAMDFNLLSTGVGRSMWDWPDRPHDTLRHPFPPQHAPGKRPATMIIYGWSIIIIQLLSCRFLQAPLSLMPAKTNLDSLYGTAAHTFPSSITIPCFTCRLSFPCTNRPDCRQVFHREAHSPDYPDNPSSGCTGHSVPPKIPIHAIKAFQGITILIWTCQGACSSL